MAALLLGTLTMQVMGYSVGDIYYYIKTQDKEHCFNGNDYRRFASSAACNIGRDESERALLYFDSKKVSCGIRLLKEIPFPLPKEWNESDMADNEGFGDLGGVKIINVFFLVGVQSGLGHVYDGNFRGVKLKYLCLGTTKLSAVFDSLASLVGVEGVMQESYAKAVSYDSIAPNKDQYQEQDPTNIRAKGKYFSDIKLPWHQIGAPGRSNPGLPLDRSKTIDENGLSSQGVIYCEAYQPGNKLTAYPKEQTGIDWFDVSLDVLVSAIADGIANK